MTVRRKSGGVAGPEVVFEVAVQEIGRRDHLLANGNFSGF
jgi:hypothetical protein